MAGRIFRGSAASHAPRSTSSTGAPDGPAEPRPSRRRMLGWGGSAAIAAFWSRWLSAAAADTAIAQPRTGKAKSVILIFNCGAPSHLDLWDMKPRAPVDVRGPFQSIATCVPGIRISELMPSVAPLADRLAIIRSVHHEHGSHNAGMYWSIVGQPYPVDSTLINPSPTDLPSIGTLVGWLARRDGYTDAIPPYVITPRPHCDSFQYITPGQFGACLGSLHDPMVLNSDPNAKDFSVPGLKLVDNLTPTRLEDRRRLLMDLETRGTPIRHTAARDIDHYRDRAMEMVTHSAVAEAFDLTREPDDVRERYGRHSWGQSHLLARRLVEAGCQFVTTVNGPSITWDTHADNFKQLKDRLVPPMERAYAALLTDLDERGLLESTIVAWMGDFGRTPLINKDAGRDHWPQCYTMVLAGGGVRGGQYVGESDSKGAYPLHRPVTPADVHATMYSLLGYDSKSVSYRTADGRPMPLSTGTPIEEVL